MLWDDRTPAMETLVWTVLQARETLLAHNAAYDLLALDRFGVVDLDEAWGRMRDTQLFSKLLDPRSKQDGSTGHKLEDLARHYLGDHDVDRYEKALKTRARDLKVRQGDIYRAIDLRDPVYHRYGAADVLATAWLFEVLEPLVMGQEWSRDLVDYEHDLARLGSVMQRRGLLVDTKYAVELGEYLDDLSSDAQTVAKSFGVESVNSTRQVADSLQALGVRLTEKTPSGLWKVDGDILESVVQHHEGPGAKLAQAVMDAKNAGKFRKTYVDGVLSALDSGARVHPSIQTLQARTARMAVSSPPLQQIPSGDWRIRRLFIAQEGNLIGAADYDQIELRVMGGLAGDAEIIRAVEEGIDLHDRTAQLLGVPRKVAKGANFTIAYGGGAGKLALSAGIPEADAKTAIKAWWRAYKGVKRYRDRLIYGSDQGRKPVVTATGRRLPLDRQRVYAALNYTIQSTARDVLGQSLLNLEAAGLRDYLLLPVHDEVLFEAPAGDIEDVAREIGEVLTMNILGTTISASGEVYGKSWGHGYGAAA